jgi:DNA-binding LacI/PurR family transcriptional regulator
MIANSDHTREKEELFVESLTRRPVDGAVMIPYHLTADDLDDLMVRTGVAIAAVGSRIEHPSIDVSYGDDAKASYEVVRWLIRERGHRRLGMICANPEFTVTKHRLAAFHRALDEAGLAAPDECVVAGDWTVETGQRSIRELLSLAEPPTAVFAASDTIAIGAMEAAESMGRRIPDDVAIVGFRRHPEGPVGSAAPDDRRPVPGRDGRKTGDGPFSLRIDGKEDIERRVFEVPCRFIERESA